MLRRGNGRPSKELPSPQIGPYSASIAPAITLWDDRQV